MEKHKLSDLPNASGIYFFRDKRELSPRRSGLQPRGGGRILYIGKAANLKNRVSSYFKTKQENPRIAKMVESAANVDWQETDSEIEALILESQLIKKHKPPFNIMLRDDKQYFYVEITKERFPRIYLTHRPSKSDNIKKIKTQILNFNSNSSVLKFKIKNLNLKSADADFLGPFTDGTALKTTLRLLRRIFPYCTCKQKHNNYCLNYHIGKCLGFCCLKQQKPNFQLSTVNSQQKIEYGKNIKAVKEILEGKKGSLIKKLKKEMFELGCKHEFEKAIELRGKIEKLEKVFKNAQIISSSPLYFDKSKYQSINRKEALAGLQRALGLSSPLSRIEGYDISNIQGKFATGAMVVFTNGRADKNQYRRFKIQNSNIKIQKKSQILNSKFQTVSDFPASTHVESEAGGFRASDFRSGGDTAMLKEVLTRRFNHPEWPYPDLIVVDGGKAQLNAAMMALKDLRFKIYDLRTGDIALAKGEKHRAINRHRKTEGLAMTKISVIALTKNEKHRGSHIYIAGRKKPIELKKLTPEIRNLILRIDAEAHRFAISYYRKLHRRLN